MTKNTINQHLADIIWSTNQHIKVRNAFFLDQSIHFKGGGERTVDAEDGLLTGIFCGICCHQVPRLWTVCPRSRSRAMIEEEASRKPSLPSCGGKKKTPFIKPRRCASKTGPSSCQHAWEDAHMRREQRRGARSSRSFCSKSCRSESVSDGAFHGWWSLEANQSARLWAHSEQEGSRHGMSFRSL